MQYQKIFKNPIKIASTRLYKFKNGEMRMKL